MSLLQQHSRARSGCRLRATSLVKPHRFDHKQRPSVFQYRQTHRFTELFSLTDCLPSIHVQSPQDAMFRSTRVLKNSFREANTCTAWRWFASTFSTNTAGEVACLSGSRAVISLKGSEVITFLQVCSYHLFQHSLSTACGTGLFTWCNLTSDHPGAQS